MINYERMKQVYPKQKAALTRAIKVADPIKRRDAVTKTCRETVAVWNEIGAWPDAWATWNCALRDAMTDAQYAGDRRPAVFQLEEL